ncbi:MAG: dihydrodipicolinate synthase family protein [Planctomycetes bacterium]|nr:dihydrodipicolinate synthase family protein [Planctomycetota bacterium]
MPLIRGVVPVIPTPFHDDGQVDFESLDALVDFAIAAGAAALCLPAFGSEFYKLTEAERGQIVERAVRRVRGRAPVVAVANHPSAREAARTARERQDQGADVICTLAPRTFSLSEADLFRYFEVVCGAVTVPFLIQEFNPGGSTVGAAFVQKLHAAHPNFQYIKLEEPMAGPKVDSILQATGGEVGVLEGWGGLYMMELIPCGICGIMPGLPMTDLLRQVFHLRAGGRADEAFEIFRELCPYIVFSLQHLELFHHLDKRFLQRRGVLHSTTVRDATIRPDARTLAYADFLFDRQIALLRARSMPVHPLVEKPLN